VGHRDYLEVLVELDVVPPVLALGVIDFKVAAALGFLFHLVVRAAEDFQGSLDLLGLRRCRGCVSKRESAACKCNSESPVVLRMTEYRTWLKSAFGRMAALRQRLPFGMAAQCETALSRAVVPFAVRLRFPVGCPLCQTRPLRHRRF
jgi:hypothetical protein